MNVGVGKCTLPLSSPFLLTTRWQGIDISSNTPLSA